jgi:WD40 repeat protein
MESDSRAIRLHPLMRDFALKTIPKNEQNKFRSNAAENLRSAYFDYPRLDSEIRSRGVAKVFDDIKVAINWWGEESQKLQELCILQDTLRLSANQITREPRQLAPQLIGRIKGTKKPMVQNFFDDATENQKGPWFYPICCSLTTPGGPLIRTFSGHTHSVYAVAISQDGKTLVSGLYDGTLRLWDLRIYPPAKRYIPLRTITNLLFRWRSAQTARLPYPAHKTRPSCIGIYPLVKCYIPLKAAAARLPR